MPVTDKDFFIAHYDEVKVILNKHQIKRCVLGHFKPTGLQMMLDTENADDYYEVEDDLHQLANKHKVIFAVSFSAFSAAGQSIPLSEDAIDFELLKNSMSPASVESEPKAIEQFVPNIPNEISKVLKRAKQVVLDIMELQKIASACSGSEDIVSELEEISQHLEYEDAHINKIKARITPTEVAFFDSSLSVK